MAGTGSVVRTLSDEALLTGLGSGDPDAAAAFVDRFQRRVFGMTLSILQDRQAAEEAAQEAFVRAWRHAAAYDARRGTVAAWLLTIARNVAVNMLPAHRAYPVDPEALLGLQETRPSPDADGQLAPVSQPMREALMRLPGEQRRALVLAGFFRYTPPAGGGLHQNPVRTRKNPIPTYLLRLRSPLGGR